MLRCVFGICIYMLILVLFCVGFLMKKIPAETCENLLASSSKEV